MSEAVHGLIGKFRSSGTIDFSKESWPSPPGKEPKAFTIKAPYLKGAVDRVQRSLWETRFVFLETIWEEFLENLVGELRLGDASIFEPFCERDFMAEVVKQALVGKLTTVDEIRTEIASRFAAGLTRKSWTEQWAELGRLQIGISKNDAKLAWHNHLEQYFEMRNCIIHRRGEVSPRLRQLTDAYKDHTQIHIWPTHLDFYRGRFLDCVAFIDQKASGRMRGSAKTG